VKQREQEFCGETFYILHRTLIPSLIKGARDKGCHLSRSDCQALLFTLRTSISLEPFIDLFSRMIRFRIADFEEEQ